MKNKMRDWVGTACVRLLVAAMVPITVWAQNPAPPDLPDSPGTVVAQAATTQQQPATTQPASSAPAPSSSPQSQTPEQTSAQPQNTTAPASTSEPANTTQPQGTTRPQGTTQPAEAPPPQQKVQKPVGTAVAEKPITTGVAASNPAGAALAPARQKRFRTLVIKVAALAGAGVAIGTVAALSAGSPSRPPGSR